jgi:hypothetical protein
MNEKFIKREEMRQTVIDNKKREKELNKIDCENSDYIMKEINDLKVSIESKLDLLDNNENKTKLEESIEEINDQYDSLKKYINDSTLYLAKYNLKLAQNILSLLRTKIDSKKSSLIPKSKFAFKKSFVTNRKNEDSKQSVCNASDVTDSANDKRFDVESTPFFGFKNINNSDKPLKISAQESNAKDLKLDNIENCLIEIYGTPNTLQINNLLNCKVFCGPITTSIFISNCRNCLFKIACQQLRVHMTSKCDIYLHVTSRAIIEDSNGLRFAPYDWSYDNITQDFKAADLDLSLNNWKEIDDFDHLSTDKPSPNWSFLT